VKRSLVRCLLVSALVGLPACGSGKSNPDDKSLGGIAESVFDHCMVNGPGALGNSGHCDDGPTETSRFLAQVAKLHLSSADRAALLTQAANDAEPYCGACADMIDRAND
jgi:hypothetical protein